mgnify:CR=1 FL=1
MEDLWTFLIICIDFRMRRDENEENEEVGLEVVNHGGDEEAGLPSAPDVSETSSSSKVLAVSKRSVDALQRKVSDGVTTVHSKAIKGLVNDLSKSGKTLAKSTKAKLLCVAERTPREAGFVSFRMLSAKNTAIQVIHNSTPYRVDVYPAPDPGTLA